MQSLFLTVGLPGSGKSTYLNENFHQVPPCNQISRIFGYNNKEITLTFPLVSYNQTDRSTLIISADNIKKQFSEYDPEHPELVHEDSVNLAERAVYDFIADGFSVIMDGGGINNNYTQRIISECRRLKSKLFVKALFFNTPIDVCIERISHRERKVPIENIYEKNQKIPRCINKLKEICDEFETIEYFTNKYIFLDMDGTICAYSKPYRDIDGNIDFVNGELFKYLKPVKSVIETVRNANYKELFILTACPNSIAWEEKQEWIKEHLPWMSSKNVYFVGNKDYKHVFLKHLMLKLKLKPQDVTMIDDNYSIIEKMREIGVNAIHPSNVESII